jgi:N-acylglucosamine 2-epimerase/mannose-6-phosphate isomerase
MNQPDIHLSRARTWLFETALPFWAERATDHRHGGTVEELALSGGPSDPGFKRVRVPARQVYVWSHAALMGWEPARELAEAHGEVFIRTCWQGLDRGWARRLRSDNRILDGRPDLYDTAFAVFALSWLYRVTGRADVLALTLDTLDFIDRHMRHPGGEGFLHALPPEGPRLQNPHMHLLEACLAGHAASGHARFERIAQEIVGLFRTRFFDRSTGTLGEYFNADWTRVTDDRGRLVEPGHQMEWAWILAEAGRRFGIDVAGEMRALVEFAEHHGVDPAGAVRNAVRDDGVVLDGGSRTWPNTERIKAAVALYEVFGDDPRPVLHQSVALLLDRYLLPDGGWIDAFDAEGRPIATAMPVSTFYHVFLALAEALRIEPLLKG